MSEGQIVSQGASAGTPASAPVEAQVSGGAVVPATPPVPAVEPVREHVRTFTQEQLNVLFADRAARAEESARAGLLAEIGVKSVDELKALAQAAAKSGEVVTERDAALKAARESSITAEATLLAVREGFEPESVPVLLRALDRSKVEEKDGKLVGLDAAIKEVAAALHVSPLAPLGTPARASGKRGGAPTGPVIVNNKAAL